MKSVEDRLLRLEALILAVYNSLPPFILALMPPTVKTEIAIIKTELKHHYNETRAPID